MTFEISMNDGIPYTIYHIYTAAHSHIYIYTMIVGLAMREVRIYVVPFVWCYVWLSVDVSVVVG